MAYPKFSKTEPVGKEVDTWRSPSGLQPPNLQRLVIEFGGYDRILPEAWARFDADMAGWKERLRHGDLHARRLEVTPS